MPYPISLKIIVMQQLQPGASLQGGKYIIERVLGQGGFGITYLAIHSFLEKEVAIKEFFPKDFCERNETTSQITLGNANTAELVAKLKEKFLKEAKNISKLTHPNIVAIHDIFEENGTAYYLMDYIDGKSLNDVIKSSGALSENIAIDYIKAIGSAISYMHSKSMNHLDIKPANIMLRSDGTPILIDFGLSKQYDVSGDQTSTTPVGISHGFAPIEQYRPGGVSTFTPQTDVYALGATLYALLQGENPPHYSDILEEGLPELPSIISNETVCAIEKALETRKVKRPSSVDEFLEMLPNSADSLHSTTQKYEKEDTQSAENEVEKKDKASNSTIEKVTPVTEKEEKMVPVEETVILNVPLQNIQSPRIDSAAKNVVETCSDNKSDYLDLGLSVKWATRLSGKAVPQPDNDVELYSFELENGKILSQSEFLSQGNQLPTIKHFEELLERCSWTTFSQDGLNGYKIKGPNGNVLIMPFGALNKYLTLQTLKPDMLEYCYFLYLGEYTHTLAKGVPTEANIWTIKE